MLGDVIGYRSVFVGVSRMVASLTPAGRAIASI